MKKIIIIIVAIAFPILIQAQTKGEKLHAKFSDLNGFESFSLSGSFLKNLDFDVDEEGLNKKVTGDCKNIKCLTFKHEIGTESKFKNIVNSQLSKGDFYKEVLTEQVKDHEDVYFYARGKEKRVNEFHILHYNKNRTSLVSFFGDFHVDELETLSHLKVLD